MEQDSWRGFCFVDEVGVREFYDCLLLGGG
jgi:hypothetical protein